MKIFTIVQGVALFCAIAVAVQNHSLGMGIALYVVITIGFVVPRTTIFIMRRVRNYNKRVTGMEAYRAQMFEQQYGKKTATQPTYRRPTNQVYTLR